MHLPAQCSSLARTPWGRIQIQSPLPYRLLTLLVSSQHPDLDVGQRQESNGLRNPLLKLVLNGCGTEQLKITTRVPSTRVQAQALLTRPWPTLQTIPSCRSQPLHRRWPAGPPGYPGPGWLGAVSRPTPRSILHPDPCRPGPGFSALRLHTPGGGRSRKSQSPVPHHHTESSRTIGPPFLMPTFRWSVVVLSSSWVE